MTSIKQLRNGSWQKLPWPAAAHRVFAYASSGEKKTWNSISSNLRRLQFKWERAECFGGSWVRRSCLPLGRWLRGHSGDIHWPSLALALPSDMFSQNCKHPLQAGGDGLCQKPKEHMWLLSSRKNTQGLQQAGGTRRPVRARLQQVNEVASWSSKSPKGEA